jgi:putative membrane protein
MPLKGHFLFMNTLLITLSILIAIEHFYFLVLEMFLWTTKKGIKTFGLKSEDFAKETKVLAANQGLYNGFLGAGILFSLIVKQKETLLFFLICIAIAGIYGAFSTKKIKLFYLQSIPALIAIILTIDIINN